MPTCTPDLYARPGCRANRLNTKPVGENAVVADLVDLLHRQLEAGRLSAGHIAQVRETTQFVDRHDMLHAVAQPCRDVAGIVGKRVGGVAVLPSAGQRMRQVPVKQGDMRRYASGQQSVDQPIIISQAFGIGLSPAIRKDAGPGDREAIGLDAQRLQKGDILLIAMIAVAGDITRVAIGDLSRRVRENVPVGQPATILLGRALDLIGGRCRAPQEAVREMQRVHRAVRDGRAGLGAGADAACERYAQRGRAQTQPQIAAIDASHADKAPYWLIICTRPSIA